MALKLLFIFLGSGVGGVLRYLIASSLHAAWPTPLPLGTILVNVTGCFAIGFLAVAMSGPFVREEYRLALLVGVLGGYTTYSAFARESMTLLHDGQWMLALLNIGLSNVLGLAAAFLGWALATRIVGPHAA